MKRLSILILTTLILACSSEKKDKVKDEEKIKEEETLKEELKIKNEIAKLVSKYHIKYMWDTLDYDFSIEYKTIINTDYQLISQFKVHDVYEKDSSVYALIKTGYYPSFYFELPISKEQENKLKDMDSEILLVADITSIQKIKFELKAEANESENLNLDNSDDFIGKGKIIDIVLIKK